MTQKDFLYKELSRISRDFPRVQFRYAFNKIISTHVVELLPLDEYLNNEELLNAWIPLSFKFQLEYPDDEISFVSSDSTLSIKEPPIFEFNPPVSCVEDISSFYTSITREEFNYSFAEVMPNGGVIIGGSITEVLNSPEQEIDSHHDMTSYYFAAA